MNSVESRKQLEAFRLRFEIQRRRISTLWQEAGSPRSWKEQKKFLEQLCESLPELSLRKNALSSDWLLRVEFSTGDVATFTIHSKKKNFRYVYSDYSFVDFLEFLRSYLDWEVLERIEEREPS